ncbi:MAG: RNA methyltransferase [Alphaproteobacteria bacterium]|nr:MAG: RNA methyltransferase [Alphaproteobacteria bacterium]
MPVSIPQAPVIILIGPQMGENIGAAARAMMNCGMTEMRIVAPRDGWPNEAATAMSAGAESILENAVIYDTTDEAVSDLQFILATTARSRDMIKPVFTPEGGATECISRTQKGQKCGILFGPERSGLVNEDVARADAVLNIPVNPEFSSLNLAQAVLLLGYCWYGRATDPDRPEKQLQQGDTLPATKEELQHMLTHLEDELAASGFFKTADRRPKTVRSLQNMFGRMDLTAQEIMTLHGIISTLSGRKSWK